jgi:uncharacterized membrane protein YqjE
MTVRPDAVEPRDARAALLLTTLGLLLTLTGAILLGSPVGFGLVALPVLALVTVIWRVRQTDAL